MTKAETTARPATRAGVPLQLDPDRLFLPLMAAGIACRVIQYLWDRSFWVDEASLVLNIRAKTAAQLLGPLAYHQAAPPIFLMCERALFRLIGGSELSLRLLPLAASCASVILFAWLARRLLPPWPALVSLAMFCFSNRILWHAIEVKQYGVDVFVAMVLTWIAVGRADRADKIARRFLTLCAVGTVAIWLSYPAVMVVGGLSLAMLPQLLKETKNRARDLTLFAVGSLLPALSFLALLRLVIRFQQTQSLGEYWAEDFLPIAEPLRLAGWFARQFLDLCNYPLEPLGVVLLPCMILGIVWLVRRGQGRVVLMLTAPLILNLIAAAAQRYPFDGKRLTLYLVPGVFLLGAAGTQAIWDWTHRRVGLVAALPAGALVAFVMASAAFHVVIPRYRGHVRPVAAYVRANVMKDDLIFALQPHEFLSYWPPDDPHVVLDIPRGDEIKSKRFWIVWSYPNDRFRAYLNPVLNWAKGFADQRLAFDQIGGCAFLFEIRSTPPHTEPPGVLTHHKTMSSDPATPPL